jgi:formate--tetrahydrofolate ligase
VRNHYGLPCVVSVNHFTADTDAEHTLLAKKMAALDVPLVLARHWAEGGAGATDLARKVVESPTRAVPNFRSSTTRSRRCGTR